MLSELPTSEQPLTIAIHDRLLPDDYRKRLRDDAEWQDGRCEFVIDPATLKLTKGSVPGFSLGIGYGWGAMIAPEEVKE